MHAAADRPEFAPPPQPGLLRGLALAVIAHLLLVVALTHGLQWQRETQEAAVVAELWSRLPQEAAPPPPPPVVAPPPPPPQPVVKAPPQPQPEPPVQRDADIALEKEKQTRELEKKKLAEERELQRKKELAAKKREEELAEMREQELAKKKLEQQKLAEKRKEDEKRKKEQQAREEREAQRVAKQREENLRRMQGMAGSGSPDAAGSAAQATGPSARWANLVQSKVRPNIVFSDNVAGNPKAEVEVRTSPDGSIIGAPRLVRSSGSPAWDDAVIRALQRTGELPRDPETGRVPSPVIIVFRPKG